MNTAPASSPERRRGARLGIDVGRARVGVAASDPGGILATPVETLFRDPKKRFDQRIILKQAAQREVSLIYVGHPLNLQGKETASTRDAVDYAEQLRRLLNKGGSEIEVRLVDERLSTVSAARDLHEAGRSARDHRAVIDQAAAVQILQHALDMEQSQGENIGRVVTVTGAPPSTEGPAQSHE